MHQYITFENFILASGQCNGLAWLDLTLAMQWECNVMQWECKGDVECWIKLKKAPNNNEQTLSKHEQDEHEQEETETCTQM